MLKSFQSQNFITFGILLIILIVPVAFINTTLAMIDVWNTNETFTHGYLIFPISIWLILKKRSQLQLMTAKPEPRLFTLLLPVLTLWIVARIVDVQVIQQISLITLIPVLIWLVYGRSVLLTILFPVLFLYFAVPLGQSLIPSLMQFTAYFTVSLVNLVGIPIYQDGLYFTLPSGNWSVVEECSGVRYLIASIALGTIYAYTSYNSYLKRSVFIIFAIIVPILANGLRAFGIVIIGHLSGMELATGVDHLVYGWVFFGIVVFFMFYIGSFWWDPIDSAASEQKVATAPDHISESKSKLIVLLVISICLVAFARVTAIYITKPVFKHTSQVSISLPDNFEAWQYDDALMYNWNPIFNNPDARLAKGYRFGDDVVQVDIGYFASQRENAEAISSMNRITDPYEGDWKITYANELQYQNLLVSEYDIRRGNEKLVIWSWYKIGSFETPNPVIAKFYQAYNKIILRREDASLISLATQLGEEKSASRKRLYDFWDKSKNEILQNLESIPKQNQN
jgi:exosortase A